MWTDENPIFCDKNTISLALLQTLKYSFLHNVLRSGSVKHSSGLGLSDQGTWVSDGHAEGELSRRFISLTELELFQPCGDSGLMGQWMTSARSVWIITLSFLPAFFSPGSPGEPWCLLCHCLPSIWVSLLWFLINALIQGIFWGTSCIHMLCWSVPLRATQSEPHVLAKTNRTREQSHCPWRHRIRPSAEESLLSLDKSILLTASLDGSLIN